MHFIWAISSHFPKGTTICHLAQVGVGGLCQ